jgi:hypothetical protein
MSTNPQQVGVPHFFAAAKKNARVIDMTGAHPSEGLSESSDGRQGAPGSGTGAGTGQTGQGTKPPPPDSSSNFPRLGSSSQKKKTNNRTTYAKISSTSRSIYDERERLKEELANRMQGSKESINPGHLRQRRYFATVEIFSMVDLATIERLAVIEKLCETMNLLSTVNSETNKLSIRMQVALNDLPSLAGIVEQLNQELGKSVIFMQPARRGERGRGKSRIVFSSERPTYDQLAEVIQLTDVNVIPVLTSEQWQCLVNADAETRVPSVLEIQAGGKNFPLDLETFEGVLANKSGLDFTIQSASGSYVRSYNQRFGSVNLQNMNRIFTFVLERKDRSKADRDVALEMAQVFERHQSTGSQFLGTTLGTWIKPVSTAMCPSSVKFHFAVGKRTSFQSLKTAMQQVYAVVAEAIGQEGHECDYKGHRFIPIESYCHKLRVDEAKQLISSKYGITLNWANDKHRVCHHCGDLHNAVLCPLMVINAEVEELIERVNNEATRVEEANITALQSPADLYYTRFVDPLAPHNRLSGGCCFTSENAVSISIPDDREESLENILETARNNWAKLRPPSVSYERPRPSKRAHVDEESEERADQSADQDMSGVDSQL